MLGIHPVRFDRVFALAAMAYLFATFLVMSYFRWVQGAGWAGGARSSAR
jgi:hypothetical protein